MRLLILLLLIPFALAETYHLPLLAVQETGTNITGSIADVYLEIREGNGRVFLDTTPLTKLDTQISTRFAKEMACNHFSLDCDYYDFIYTIHASSNIIGGPSAGAALTAITTIALEKLNYNQKITITGTINSGGIIGPVGGIKQKIEAASKNGINTVLIAKGLRNYTEDNITIDLIELGKSLNLKIIEVDNINDVIYHYTGKKLQKEAPKIKQNTRYSTIMQKLQQTLCEREIELSNKVTPEENLTSELKKRREKADNATLKKNYYSAASLCFSNNIIYRRLWHENNTNITQLAKKLKKNTLKIQQHIYNQPINTISDLQTRMIVEERIRDTLKNIEQLNKTPTAGIASYAEERLHSAISWMQFFAMPGKKFNIKEKLLRQSCQQKIAEANERAEYSSVFLGEGRTRHIKEKIKQARNAKTPTLCLIAATQAKAEANAILSSLGLSKETLDSYLTNKQQAAERIIAENSAEGIFPILGYSYYEYAKTLRIDDPYAALLYLEYTLEMADLSPYFPTNNLKPRPFRIPKGFYYLIIGIAIGAILTYLLIKKTPANHRSSLLGKKR